MKIKEASTNDSHH